MFSELSGNGIKYTKENTMWIVRKPDGQISWLEIGNAESGFQHIVTKHFEQFTTKFGISSETQLSEFIFNVVSQQSPIQIMSDGGCIYSIGASQVRIVIGSNGYIVTAHPIT